jgi:PhoPQ-activated pathogenicity-related protein
VVTGASKRGWTTWFVGAAKDPRVKGIAPMVIDNLNVKKQMKHQIDTWGFYSEEIEDYTRRGLQKRLETPIGKRLAQIIDPYSYRSNITIPTLIVRGANDPYWTADALNQYWDDLKEPKWAVTVPNAGHGLGNKLEAVESIGAFARSLSGDFAMPKEKWSIAPVANNGRTIEVALNTTGTPLAKVTVWAAESDTLDFRKSTYKVVAELKVDNPTEGGSRPKLRLAIDTTKNLAVFGEARYRVGKREFSLCCPTQIFKKKAE